MDVDYVCIDVQWLEAVLCSDVAYKGGEVCVYMHRCQNMLQQVQTMS